MDELMSSDFGELYEMINSGASMVEVIRHFGGTPVHIPSMRNALPHLVRAEFTGENQRELARRHGVTVATIYKYLRDIEA